MSLIESVISATIVFGIFNSFSKADVCMNLSMYSGIGSMTSKRDGFANPSFPLILDRNNCGEKAIRIFSLNRHILYLYSHQQNFPLVINMLYPTHQQISARI